MSGALRDRPIFKELGRVGTTDTIKWTTEVPIGASGATGTLLRGPNGIAFAKNTTGVYDGTGLPITPAGKGRFQFGLYSPLLTVTECTVTAYDGAAGTMTFTTSKGGTAAEPASGDKVWVYFEGEGR